MQCLFAARSISSILSSNVRSRDILIFLPVIMLRGTSSSLLDELPSAEESEDDWDEDDEEVEAWRRDFLDLCFLDF